MNNNLDKEFKVPFIRHNGAMFVISRADYEGLPDPMCASRFTDEQMEQLANNIGVDLNTFVFDTQSKYIDDKENEKFWEYMETDAVELGMGYYEDEN